MLKVLFLMGLGALSHYFYQQYKLKGEILPYRYLIVESVENEGISYEVRQGRVYLEGERIFNTLPEAERYIIADKELRQKQRAARRWER